MNRLRSFAGIILAVVMALYTIVPSDVHATLINYSFSGTGSGTLNNTGFSNAPFHVSIDADINDIAYQANLGANGLINLSGTIHIGGFGIAGFTLPLFVYAISDGVGFGNFSNGNLITIVNASLLNYDLASDAGPATGQNLSLRQFHDVATTSGALTYSSMSDATFIAKTNPVPLPNALLLLGSGLIGFVGMRRTFGKYLRK